MKMLEIIFKEHEKRGKGSLSWALLYIRHSGEKNSEFEYRPIDIIKINTKKKE